MANCFTLTRKGESKPASLQGIDDEMRLHFGEPPDAKQWLYGWYNTIGFALALGRDWNQIREEYAPDPYASDGGEFDRKMVGVCDWLEANFTANAWAECGR